MKKLLLTVIASSVLAANATTYGASSYDSAVEVRDALTDVYDSLGATDGTDDFANSNAGDEYAELLYMIDYRGSVDPISLSFLGGGGLDDADGGDESGEFTLAEIIAQIEVFETDLEADLFGTYDHDSSASQAGVDFSDDTQDIGTGLATNYLETIVDRLNEANDIINDVSQTQAAKIAARNSFFDFYYGDLVDPTDDAMTGTREGGGAKDNFNNAVNALTHIAASLGSVSTLAGLTNFILDGSGSVHNATCEAAGNCYTIAGANIPHESGALHKFYDSYTAYVAGDVSISALAAASGVFAFTYDHGESWSWTHSMNLSANILPFNATYAAAEYGGASEDANRGIEITFQNIDGTTSTFGIRYATGSAAGVTGWAIHPANSAGVKNSASVREFNVAGQTGFDQALQYLVDYHDYVDNGGTLTLGADIPSS